MPDGAAHAQKWNGNKKNIYRIYTKHYKIPGAKLPWVSTKGGVRHKANGNRVIDINYKLNALKKEDKEKLQTETGIYHRKKRCADVEPVFANIKNNHGFKRFMLRGKEKVTVEVGLISLAHNLRKKCKENLKKAA